MSCPGRHHDWNTDVTPPTCRKCGDPKKPAGRPKGSGTKKAAGAAVAGRLAASLGVAAPPPRAGTIMGASPGSPAAAGAPTPVMAPGSATAAGHDPAAASSAASTVAPTVAPDEEKAAPGRSAPPLKAKGWCKSAGKRLAKLFVAGTEFALEKMHRKANEPDDDDVDDFGEALGAQMTVWFPDTELTPAKQLLLAGAFIVGEMAIGSEKIPRKPAGIADAKPGQEPTTPATRPTLSAVPKPPEPPAPVRVADITPVEIRPQP
jgi:hypothetical protein